MSFKAWRVKVSICQSDPAVSPLPPESPPRIHYSSPSRAPAKDDVDSSPLLDPKPQKPKQLPLMDGVSPSASQKVSKPSLGVRVLRTLFDNSPPAYTPAKSQAAAAAAQAKEQHRLQEIQKAQEQQKAQQQAAAAASAAQAQAGQKNGSSRPPTPKNLSGEWKQSDGSHRAARGIEKLGPGERFPPPGAHSKKKGGREKASNSASRSPTMKLLSNETRSSFDSFDDAHSSVSTDSEHDSSSTSFHRSTGYQEREVSNMNRSVVRDLEGDRAKQSTKRRLPYEIDRDDSLVSAVDAEQDPDPGQKLEYLKHEIERLRLENLVLRQRGTVTDHQYHDGYSDLSRASSMTEGSTATEEAIEEWIPRADYAPPGVSTSSVAKVHGPQPGGYRRGDTTARHPPGERYFPGEHAARVANRGGGGGGGWGHESSSETVSMVTDGSRASSRHNSGLLVDPEPQSGLTSRHNSGLRSDQEDYASMMSWDGQGSRHSSGPIVVDRQELYGLANNHHSRNNSGVLADCDDHDATGGGSVTPLAGNSRENSRHNSGMQVDRDGRNLPPGLLSPRISFDGKPMAGARPVANSTIKTVEETFTSHRLVTRERRHVIEPESWNDEDAGKQKGNDESSTQARSSRYEIPQFEEPTRTSSNSTPPSMATQVRSFEAPRRTTTPPPPSFERGDRVGDFEYLSQNTSTSPAPAGGPRRNPTPPRSRNPSQELDPASSSMFSYPIPSFITLPRSRSTHNQPEAEDLSEFLQHHSSSIDNSHINSVPRSRSAHSQMSTEDLGIPSSTAASQHQSTLERLMISQQRRQNMSSNPVSLNASPEYQFSRNSRQDLNSRSPSRR